MTTENRKSKCPCLKNKQPCGKNCHCKNCQNGFGENTKSGIDTSPRPPANKRRRSNPSPYKKSRSVDFLLKHQCEPTSSIWSQYEIYLLFSTVNVIVSSLVPLTVNNMTTLYNHVVESSTCKSRKLPVRLKNISQVQGKLKHLEEKQKVTIAKAGGREGASPPL